MDMTRWLSADDAARYLSLRVDAFLRRVKAGKMPPASYHLGARSPRWDREALDLRMEHSAASSHRQHVSRAVDELLRKGRARRSENLGRRHRPGISLPAASPANP